MANDSTGVDPSQLDDADLRRELAHMHETRHDAMLGGSEDAFEAHTTRMLALEREFLRRFPQDSAADPLRTRAGSRKAAGQD